MCYYNPDKQTIFAVVPLLNGSCFKQSLRDRVSCSVPAVPAVGSGGFKVDRPACGSSGRRRRPLRRLWNRWPERGLLVGMTIWEDDYRVDRSSAVRRRRSIIAVSAEPIWLQGTDDAWTWSFPPWADAAQDINDKGSRTGGNGGVCWWLSFEWVIVSNGQHICNGMHKVWFETYWMGRQWKWLRSSSCRKYCRSMIKNFSS